jgi:hypothetical protein
LGRRFKQCIKLLNKNKDNFLDLTFASLQQCIVFCIANIVTFHILSLVFHGSSF